MYRYVVNFEEILRTLRTNAGMSQTELAKRLNISKAVVSYYEVSVKSDSV